MMNEIFWPLKVESGQYGNTDFTPFGALSVVRLIYVSL